MAYSNYSPAYSEDPAPKKRIARSAELPTALTMPNGQPASMDDVRSMYLGQKPVASAVTPQAQPTRIATSAEMPQSMMGMVANRVRAQGAPSQPMQARPVQQTPTIAGFGVGGQAQANRNARLQAGGVDLGMAQRNYYNLRDTRDAHNFAATELRKLANKARERGDLAGASSLMREASQIQRQADSINRDVVSNYSMLAGSVGDLDPATQQRNRDRLNAQIPNAQKMITQQFEADADLKRQKMLAADKRIMERTKNGYTSQPQMDYDKLLGDAAFKDASNADAELMRRRAMLARDGASDLPAFQPFAQPELNLSGILRDQENTLADRATASTVANNQRLQVENQSAADAAMPELAKIKAELENKVLSGQIAAAEANAQYAKAEADAVKSSIANKRTEDAAANEHKARTLEVQNNENYIAGLAEKIGPALLHIYANAGDTQFVDDTSLQSQNVQEALSELEQMSPAVKAEVANRVLKQLEKEKVAGTISPRSGFKKVGQAILDVSPVGAVRQIYNAGASNSIASVGKRVRENPIGFLLGNDAADQNSTVFNSAYATLRRLKLMADMK